jgi:hypothetical protein
MQLEKQKLFLLSNTEIMERLHTLQTDNDDINNQDHNKKLDDKNNDVSEIVLILIFSYNMTYRQDMLRGMTILQTYSLWSCFV